MALPSELFQSDKFIPVVPSHPARANLFQQQLELKKPALQFLCGSPEELVNTIPSLYVSQF